MILCFDVGNTDIFAGVFDGRRKLTEFRRSSRVRPSADEFGVFLLQFLHARQLDPGSIEGVAIASVVPECGAEVAEACRRYLDREPLQLQAGVRTGLKIRICNPAEVGADRIADAIAAIECFPDDHRIVIDLGTATTFTAIDRERQFLGGVITAGLSLSMRALAENTAKLTTVEIVRPQKCLGRTTVESIQSGLYFGHLGMMKSILQCLTSEVFGGDCPKVIGTGGHARFYKDAGIFDEYVPDLVLLGLRKALELNRNQ